MAVLLRTLLASLGLLCLVGCNQTGLLPLVVTEPAPAVEPGGDRYPDVLLVELRPRGEHSYDVVVTLSSPYDTPQRYADGWRVLAPNGDVLGTHTLMHDHASEQPFTRTQPGVVIPADVETITVEGRDQANGFGGLTLTVEVPES
jgi:hypothetical protein